MKGFDWVPGAVGDSLGFLREMKASITLIGGVLVLYGLSGTECFTRAALFFLEEIRLK